MVNLIQGLTEIRRIIEAYLNSNYLKQRNPCYWTIDDLQKEQNTPRLHTITMAVAFYTKLFKPTNFRCLISQLILNRFPSSYKQ